MSGGSGVRRRRGLARRAGQRLLVVFGGAVLTAAFFLVLPLLKVVTGRPVDDLLIRSVDRAELPPPPPPPPEEKPEEEKPEEVKPPELADEAPPLDLSALELALNPALGDGLLAGDFAVRLQAAPAAKTADVDALFSIADLDQKPRVVYQPSPSLGAEQRKKAPGTVHVLFIVDQNGKVENPVVQNSTDPAFERPALSAVRQWRFEPGKRAGKPVRFRMRVPITFPKGGS